MTAASAPSPVDQDAEWRGLARAVSGFLVVFAPIGVGFVCTVRALLEFAYGGPIYGPGGHPWALGEWMISYASGFVRRGLTGEIMIPLAHLFGSPAVPFLLVNLACAILVASALLVRYAGHGRTEAALMLYLPTSVLFALWDYNVVGRKEQLVLAFCAVLSLVDRGRARSDDGIAPSLIVGCVAAAMMPLHEGLIFFLPLMFALLEIRRPPGPIRPILLRLAVMLGPSAMAFVAIAAMSRPIDTKPLFDAIPVYGPGMAEWCKTRGIGSICWLGFSNSFVVGYVYNVGFEGFFRAAALIVLQAAAVTSLALRLGGGPADRRVRWLLAIGWLGVAPLFFVSFDWGRWIATITMMFVLLAPLRSPVPRSIPVLLGAAVLMSVFTVGHLQSQSFEVGGPLLVRSLLQGGGAFSQ